MFPYILSVGFLLFLRSASSHSHLLRFRALSFTHTQQITLQISSNSPHPKCAVLVFFEHLQRTPHLLQPDHRLPPGSQLGLYFRAPDRADSKYFNHCSRPLCCDLGAPQTSLARISALAVFPSPRDGQQ